jgi:ADP-ribose pyrophosphatase YjhB (NUDIX family)
MNQAQQAFTIGAFAIIFDDAGRVLLCHRRDRDMWNLPGGGVESGELPSETVVRETKEEVGLDVAVERLVGVYGKPEKDEFVFAFVCRVVGGRLCLTNESDENRFFEIDRLPANISQKQVSRIQDALHTNGQPVFRRQTESSAGAGATTEPPERTGRGMTNG